MPSIQVNTIVKAQLQQQQVNYSFGQAVAGTRPDNFIAISAQRSAQLAGEHEVSFTNGVESLAIKQRVFNSQVFADGVLTIVDWLQYNQPAVGLYTMFDVVNF